MEVQQWGWGYQKPLNSVIRIAGETFCQKEIPEPSVKSKN